MKVARSRIQYKSNSNEDEYGSNENTHAADISKNKIKKRLKIVSALKRKGNTQITVLKSQSKATQSKPTRLPPPKVYYKTNKVVISLLKPHTKGKKKSKQSKRMPSAKEPFKQVLNNNKIYIFEILLWCNDII